MSSDLQHLMNENRKQQAANQHTLDVTEHENDRLQKLVDQTKQSLTLSRSDEDMINQEFPLLEKERREQAHQLTQSLSQLVLWSSKLEYAKIIVKKRKETINSTKIKYVESVLELCNKNIQFETSFQEKRQVVIHKKEEALQVLASKEKIAEALNKRRAKLAEMMSQISTLVYEKDELDTLFSVSTQKHLKFLDLVNKGTLERSTAEKKHRDFVRWQATLMLQKHQLKVDIKAARRARRRQEQRARIQQNKEDEIESNSSDDFEDD
jgi:hypothetical protein